MYILKESKHSIHHEFRSRTGGCQLVLAERVEPRGAMAEGWDGFPARHGGSPIAGWFISWKIPMENG